MTCGYTHRWRIGYLALYWQQCPRDRGRSDLDHAITSLRVYRGPASTASSIPLAQHENLASYDAPFMVFTVYFILGPGS